MEYMPEKRLFKMEKLSVFMLTALIGLFFYSCAAKQPATLSQTVAGASRGPVLGAPDNGTKPSDNETLGQAETGDNKTGETVPNEPANNADQFGTPASEPAKDNVPAADEPPAGDIEQKISLNFDNADIYEVINALSDSLGINYIIDPAIKGRVNIHTSTEIDKDRLLPILETIFEMNNIALVESTGDFYKIVPIKEAKKEISDFYIGKSIDRIVSHDRMIIQVVPLEYVEAAETEKLLKPFISRGGDIFDYSQGNYLVIIETAGNIRKLLSLINLVDVDVFKQTTIRFFPVENAPVDDLAKELEDIFSSVGINKNPEKGIGLKFIPIERVSCILAVSSIPGILDRAQHWLEVLDTVDVKAEEQIFIYFVENGKADEIADVLHKVYGEGKSEKDTKTVIRRTKKTKGKTPQQSVTTATIQGEIKIVTDEATNSIIVRATPHDYNIIKKTILQLDMIPKQVLIEVLIAEVSLSGDTEFGVEWALLGDRAEIGGYKGQDKAGIDFGIGGLGTDLTKNLGRGFTYRFDSNRLQAFLVAQASKNKLNILSSPHILATDNKEARIEVGQEVPIITSEYVPQDVEANTSTSRSIEYRSTGVILTVTPRINEKGLVAMEISQEVSEAQPVVAGGIQSPVISNRKAETSLVVQDGQTIVIGGLIKDQSNQTVSGVPILSSIPLVSYLFSDTKNKKDKTELIILITPHVVNNIEEARATTTGLKNRLKQIKKLIEKGGEYWEAY